MQPKSLCIISDCKKLSRKRGWCEMHYDKWRRWGDPLGGEREITREEIFNKNILKGTPNECWGWKFKPNKSGYCTFIYKYASKRADIVAYELYYDCEVPPDKTIKHLCHDNNYCKKDPTCSHRSCMNPNHMELESKFSDQCSVENCGRTLWARGLCKGHWQRWRRSPSEEVGIPSFQKPSLHDFFLSQLPKERFKNQCWPWGGVIDNSGYPVMNYNNQHWKAHRFSYEYFVGLIPEGLVLDHICHTNDLTCRAGRSCPHRRCVNPYHLEPVTLIENCRRARPGGKGKPGKKIRTLIEEMTFEIIRVYNPNLTFINMEPEFDKLRSILDRYINLIRFN